MSMGSAGHGRAWIAAMTGLLLVFMIIMVIMMFGYGLLAPTRMAYTSWFPFFGFWIFIWILLMFFMMRWMLWPRGLDRRRSWMDSREIARQRYARGEITKEQFDQMMRDLGQP